MLRAICNGFVAATALSLNLTKLTRYTSDGGCSPGRHWQHCPLGVRMLRIFKPLALTVALALSGLTLSGCVSTTSLAQLSTTTPTGSAFTQLLFKNYVVLANSLGAKSGGGWGGSFDSSDSLSIFDSSDDFSDLAETFATKALIAANGTEPDPEPGRDDQSTQARDRLLAGLAEGKDHFSDDAARAQTDFDCWMLNASIESRAGAASQCRESFVRSIAKLESDNHPPNVSPPPTAPPAPTATPAHDYTVYFDFDSWTLTGEQLTMLQDAINTARTGGQTHITIVGHTDTSGSASYNQDLSIRRANVVKETLIQMGARAEAVEVSGVGESDLAVPTPDDVREPKNRRAVVTLLP